MSAHASGQAPDVIVGIDLGTTNTVVAVCDQRGPRVLRVEGDEATGGAPLIPSVVRFEPDGTVVVGARAKREAPAHAARTVASVKRLIGRGVADGRGDARALGLRVEAGARDTLRLIVPKGDEAQPAEPGVADAASVWTLTPEEVSARVLSEAKRVAELALGHAVRRAVVTVPAYFDDAQRQATRVAGRLAGLEVVRIVPEPTAAALAYGLGLARAADERTGPAGVRHVAVYDLGGGTFDVSVLRLTPAEREGENEFYQVLATAGDTHLGGDDIDQALAAWLLERAGPDATGGASLDAGARRALLGAAERAKIELSERASTRVVLELGAGRTREVEVTRDTLETLAQPLVERTLERCAQALRDAGQRGLPEQGLDAVVLVGGSTRMPLVRRRVAEFFGQEPYTALDPDLVVALGASVQGAILSGQRRGSLLLDVIPLSLGLETVGGAVAKIIVRNSTVPATASEFFSTSVDNQTSIRLTVYQGEREMASDCRKLGEFFLRGLPPMPAGVPQVQVRFVVDANGVLTVQASERRTGLRAQLQVVPNHGLTSAEVDEIERASVLHAREDMRRHRIVDLVVNSALDMKWIEERLARFGTQLEPAYAQELRTRLDELRALHDRAKADWTSVDGNAFQRSKEALDRASMRLQEVAIAAALRERAGEAGPGAAR